MQKNTCLIDLNIDRCMSDFESDADMLSSDTRLLLCDENGKIVASRNKPVKNTAFECIATLVEKSGLETYLLKRNKADCFVLEMKDGKGKQFLVLSKTEPCLSRGVICSFGEDNCTRLSDYYRKLCSYKDYLDSFSGIMLSRIHGKSAISKLEERLSGVTRLVELSERRDDERIYEIPVAAAIEKSAKFVGCINENACSGVFVKNEIESNVTARLPVRFMKILVLCIGIALRYSQNGGADISVCDYDGKSAEITISSKVMCGDRGIRIYEDALMKALESIGVAASFDINDGVFVLKMKMGVSILRAEALAELDEVTQIINITLAKTSLLSMCRTIMDVI